MGHDPEKWAAFYLSGDMSRRRRAAFERHILECEDCWREVGSGRAGRSLAEAGRELAPQEMRERVRAAISAAQEPRLRWRPRWGLTGVLVLIGFLAGGLLTLRPESQPDVIKAVLEDFRNPPGSTEGFAGRLPGSLGDLVHAATYTRTLGGIEVTAHSYRDPAGHQVVVYQADETFPLAAGARHSSDGRTWTAKADGAVLFCADIPIPSLVVGDDDREVALAVEELGLR